MTPNQHNTRVLSRGDQITADDFNYIPETEADSAEFLPVDRAQIGLVLTGDIFQDGGEYFRYNIEDPFFSLCWEYGIKTPRGVDLLRKAIEVIADVEKKRFELQALEAKLFW